MNVFISWSGNRSKEIAAKLREWLSSVLQSPSYFMSENDIRAGESWFDEITENLQGSNFGILCLTPENVNADWVLFEAGALSKAKGAKVVPLLCDMEPTDLTGPLATLQAETLDRKGCWSVVKALHTELDSPPALDSIKNVFEGLWPQLAGQIDQIRATEEDAPEQRAIEDMVREVLEVVRQLARERETNSIEADEPLSENFSYSYPKGFSVLMDHFIGELVFGAIAAAHGNEAAALLSTPNMSMFSELFEARTGEEAAREMGILLIKQLEALEQGQSPQQVLSRYFM